MSEYERTLQLLEIINNLPQEIQDALKEVIHYEKALRDENAALRAFVGIPDGVTVASVEDILNCRSRHQP